MRKRNLFMCAAVLLCCWSAVGLADEGEAFVEGTGSVGAHSTNYTGNPQKAGEYVNLTDTKSLMADLYLDMFGGTNTTLYKVGFLFQDSSTQSFSFNMDSGSYVALDLGFDSFVHNLDHDLLTNLQAKEANPDGSGGYVPGGKQVYYTDNDPMAQYYLEYSKFHGDVTLDVPMVENGQITLGYSEQRKTGWKQTMTIEHCAFCHVQGHSQRVDQKTDVWTAGIQGTAGNLSLSYDFLRSEYSDIADNPSHQWKDAIHPVNGGSGGEFTSRHIFDDVTRPYGLSADTEKTSHSAAAKLDLAGSGTVKGSYTYTKNRNFHNGIENKFNAGAVGYAVKLNKDMRLTTKFLAYETKVDDWFVNLPSFRATDTVSGNLDFDWNRISSANRKVYQFDANLGWKLAKSRHLKVNWRTQIIDREAMAQSQTSYLFDGVNPGESGATLVPSEAFANKTTINRLKLRYDARLGMKGRYNVSYAYTNVDKPYMNPTAMCEESIADENTAHPGTIERLYYFQRERYGMGTNQPNQAHKLTMKGSYQLSARSSFNAFLTYAKDKNDELNVYEYDRDMFTPGFNFWTAPSDRVMFTLGWTYNKVKSNANLCIPIFDG
jgi:hypothetical protein